MLALCVGFFLIYWFCIRDDSASQWKEFLAKTKPHNGKGRRVALIVNITYRDSTTRTGKKSLQLDGTITDGQKMEQYLKSAGFKVIWMRDDRCAKFHKHKSKTACTSCKNEVDANGFKIFPNVTNIKAAMRGLASASEAGDVLWFCYAGHGSQLKDTDGDEADGKDEIVMPADYDLGGGYITDDWLKSSFRSKIHKKAETVAVFDCCHSGTMFDLPYVAKLNPSPELVKKKNAATPSDDDPMFFYLSGCQDAQTAAEEIKGDDRNGAMTKSMTELMYDGGLNWPLDKFLRKLRDKLAKHKSKDGKPQKPNICASKNFDLKKTSFAQMFDGKTR